MLEKNLSLFLHHLKGFNPTALQFHSYEVNAR